MYCPALRILAEYLLGILKTIRIRDREISKSGFAAQASFIVTSSATTAEVLGKDLSPVLSPLLEEAGLLIALHQVRLFDLHVNVPFLTAIGH